MGEKLEKIFAVQDKIVNNAIIKPLGILLNTRIGKECFGRVVNQMRKKTLKNQYKQQKKVEEYYSQNDSVNVKSYYRNPDGQGELSLVEELEKDKNNLVLLYSGVLLPQDLCQSIPESIAKLGLVGLSLHPDSLLRYRGRVFNILERGTISGYMINTINKIQTEIFNNEAINTLIVRNASKEDFINIAKYGGGSTVLVVGGHGTYDSVNLTDGIVTNKDVGEVEDPLKAFIQHSCALGKNDNEIGKGWADKTYGWKRLTSPIDFVINPLNERSNFKKES